MEAQFIEQLKKIKIYQFIDILVLIFKFLDPCNLKEFDLLIYCAGIHVSNIYENEHLIKKAKNSFCEK